MKVEKLFEAPRPPMAVGVKIDMNMEEANRLLWSLNDCTLLGAAYEFRLQLRKAFAAKPSEDCK